ncbi:MAG: putative sulfate exporter family transporter [Candidatus Phlomobacter fragariae]
MVAIAVATTIIFGTLAIFLYPWFYHLNQIHHWFSLAPPQFSIFIGSIVSMKSLKWLLLARQSALKQK